MKRTALVGCLFLVFAVISTLARSSEINEKFREDDPRLLRKVTINAHRMLVGDLIAELRKQTGVAVEIDAKDYAPGVELFASFHDTPLSEVLDAIWSLFSNADASYRWYREGKRGAYRYSFYEPDAVKRRAERLGHIAADAYVNYVNILCDLAEMAPEQRRHNKDMLRKALLDVDEHEIERTVNDDHLWTQISLFSELVPQSGRSAILFGDRIVNMKVEDASAKAQELFGALWRQLSLGTVQEDGTLKPEPMPTTLRFYAVSRGVVPDIMMDQGSNTRVSLISTMRLKNSLESIIRRKWLLPLDTPAASLEEQKVHPPTDAEKRDEVDLRGPSRFEGKTPAEIRAVIKRSRENGSMDTKLEKVFAGTNPPILAVLPDTRGIGFTTGLHLKAEPTIGESLAALETGSFPLMHKWRNGFCLVSYPKWFFDNEHSLQYSYVKEFFSNGEDNISLVSLARLINKASERELAALGDHFSIVQRASSMRYAFLLYKANQRILSDEGIPIDAQLMRYVQTALPINRNVMEGRIERIRISEVNKTTKPMIAVQGYVDGRWLVLDMFRRLSE